MAIVNNLDFLWIPIKNLKCLILIGSGVGVNLLSRNNRTRLGLSGGVTDHRGKVPDDQNDLVAEVLELPELSEEDGVAEVNVGGAGIETGLDAKRAFFFFGPFKTNPELRFVDNVYGVMTKKR